MAGIPLAVAICELRKEIMLAMANAPNEEIRFRLGPIELELQVERENSSDPT